MEARIHHIMWELRQAWHPPVVRPCWRLHIQAFPELWNKTGVFPPSGGIKKLSRTAFDAHGLVGMDIKSHHTEAPFFPTDALVHGNTKVDLWCERARLLPMPGNVEIPSSPASPSYVIKAG